MGTIWNFIDEVERDKELYGRFSSREGDVLSMLQDVEQAIDVIRDVDTPDEFEDGMSAPHMLLREMGVSEAEIQWLERTGRVRRGSR